LSHHLQVQLGTLKLHTILLHGGDTFDLPNLNPETRTFAHQHSAI